MNRGRSPCDRKGAVRLPARGSFFEELLCGGDVSDFLSPKLKPRAKDFKEFVGDFIAVLPPPNFVKQSLVTLLYKDKIEYADVKLNGGLIENVVLT